MSKQRAPCNPSEITNHYMCIIDYADAILLYWYYTDDILYW